MFDIKLYDETGERETIRGLSWSQMTTVQSVIARLHFLLGNRQYKHKTNQVADENTIAAQAAEIAALREVLEPFAHPDLCEYLPANKDRGNSPLFQRNKAVITINDCRRAARALKGAK